MYSPVSVEAFQGLNLVDDPGTVGWNQAVDALNVTIDRTTGQLKTRPGMTLYKALTGNLLGLRIAPHWRTASTHQWLISGQISGGAGNARVDAFTGTGAATSQNLAGSSSVADFCQISTLGQERTYISDTGGTMFRWNGTAFASIANSPACWLLGKTPWDNRLVAGAITTLPTGSGAAAADPSLVHFSDAGAPETWSANNFLSFQPGDGEYINALVTWRDLLFVVKESRFFVVYGTSTDSSGNPIFNYRAVDAGAGAGEMHMAVAGKDGVYMANKNGVFVTTGGEPQRISGPIDSLFTDEATPEFWTSGINVTSTASALAYVNDKLFIYLGGKSLVYDTITRTWTYWEFPVASQSAIAGYNTNDGRDFVLVSLAGNVYQMGSSYTDDNGTSITSRYRSGFSDLGTSDVKTIREWKLQGSGSPTFKTSTDFGSLSTGSTVTLGTSPAVAEARDRTAVRGRQIGWQVSGTSAWTLNNLVAHTREKKSAGTDA